MILLPAIDLYEGKVVRLTRGDYSRMTVYREDPLDQAREFEAAGAAWLHTVDLEGARDGATPNFRVVAELCRSTGLQVEVGGGIRTLEAVARYLDAGALPPSPTPFFSGPHWTASEIGWRWGWI